ncbi:TetR/AcrR family transcriptional regulator [Yoonia sp. BS5-3]|uniref:TetR/AcrR family transcriptional regulator n=1 Tax=Yoonia phaeophyticola TaxID=3137369 RepID=A0ABZ2V2C3_9RHOB
MAEKKKRLERQDWINAGFRALTVKGPEGLRVEPIARELRSTKGSFYWHFNDLNDLHYSMLEYWQSAATEQIIARLQALPRGLPRLLALVQAVNMPHEAQGGAGAEAAVRAWGQSYVPARDAMRAVDQRRLAFLSECFADMGLTDPELPRLLYAAHLGLEQLSMHADVDPARTLAHLVSLLAEESSA